MKHLTALAATAVALLLLASISLQAQQPSGAGGRSQGRGDRGNFGPQLPAEQQAQVDRVITVLESEANAVAAANANLIAATFTMPIDKERIAKANDELAKAREAWANKASQLFSETQASEKKLSPDAVAALIRNASGRGGRSGFGRGGFGRGGANNPAAGGRRGAEGRGEPGRAGGP